MNGTPLAITGDVKNTIKSIAKTNGFSEEDNVKAFRTEDLETVVKECDAILEVRVISIAAEGVIHNGTTYDCVLEGIIKGDNVPVDENGMLLVVSMKDSFILGTNYYVTVTLGGEHSLVNSLASPQGIIPTYEVEAYKQLLVWLEE